MHTKSKQSNDINDVTARIIKVLEGAHCIFLFGSFNSHFFSEDSDIDIAILFPKAQTLKRIISLKNELEQTLERDVDLVDLYTADPILSFQVLNSGRLIHMADKENYYRFIEKTLSGYADFKIDRKPIEAAFVQGYGL